MIKYTLPPLTADVYAGQAIAILEAVQEQVPQALPVMARSDVVLTISGVRAQTTYVDFPAIEQGVTDSLKAVLAARDIYLFDGTSQVIDIDEPENWFINHGTAFDSLAERYGTDVFPKLKRPVLSMDDHIVWSASVEANIAGYLDRQTDGPLASLRRDIWSVHDLRFGMLLGYPAEAIISLAQLDDDQEGRRAEIAYHDMYDAAWPVYFYGQEAANEPNIVRHQKLWSGILTAVYQSDWHGRYKAGLETA